MGCKPTKPQSRESLRAANLRDMQKNKTLGKDAMGHDKGIPRVTPGTPEAAILMRQMNKARSHAGTAASVGVAFAL